MTTPIYNDAKAAAAQALVKTIRDKVDCAYDAIVAEAGLTREEKARLMVEINNQYARNDVFKFEVGLAYQPAENEPEP